MLARVKHQNGDKAEIEEHVFTYHRFHRMLLVPERIADELSGIESVIIQHKQGKGKRVSKVTYSDHHRQHK